MSNILIIKHGSLGDIAQASGAIEDIYENHKNDDLYILTTKPYFELLKKNPFIKDVIIDKRLSRFNLIYLYLLTLLIYQLHVCLILYHQDLSHKLDNGNLGKISDTVFLLYYLRCFLLLE